MYTHIFSQNTGSHYIPSPTFSHNIFQTFLHAGKCIPTTSFLTAPLYTSILHLHRHLFNKPPIARHLWHVFPILLAIFLIFLVCMLGLPSFPPYFRCQRDNELPQIFLARTSVWQAERYPPTGVNQNENFLFIQRSKSLVTGPERS